MGRTAAACAVALGVMLMAGAGPAGAHPPPCDGCYDQPKPPPRNELEVGPWIVFVDLDGYAGLFRGGRLAAGHRWHGLLLQGEVDLGDAVLTKLHHDALDHAIRGYAARAGANVRWRFGTAHFGHGLPLEYRFWLQGGLGAHVVQWWGGGRLLRVDGQAGLGMSQVIGKAKRFSLDSAVVVLWTGARASGGPTCAGPCDEPTPALRGRELDVVDHVAFTVRW